MKCFLRSFVRQRSTFPLPMTRLPQAHSTMNLTPQQRRALDQLIQQGKQIEAIKLLRDTHHLSLLDAKEHVERIASERHTGPLTQQTKKAARPIAVFSLVGKIFVAVGTILIGVAVLVFYLKHQSIAQREVSTGVVRGLYPNHGGAYAPLIAYSFRGQSLTYQSYVYTSPPEYHRGEKVTIYINPDDPSDILIDSFTDRWVDSLVIGCLGIFFFGFGFLFIIAERKF